MDELQAGDVVMLNVPENPRLHGAVGNVIRLEEWGAHVGTDAAATGRFRAFWSEMDVPKRGELRNAEKARTAGYTGEQCQRCSSWRTVRAGACIKCEECFESGCS